MHSGNQIYQLTKNLILNFSRVQAIRYPQRNLGEAFKRFVKTNENTEAILQELTYDIAEETVVVW